MAFRSPRAEVVLAALLLSALAIGLLIWLYYPVVPRSVLGWVMLFVIGVPSWLFLEWLGNRIFAARIFSRMGSAARIALAVPIMILFFLVAGYVIHLGQRVIAGS